jgi:hypothetical protein
VDRFGAALTRWIRARGPATAGDGFWSEPPQAIDAPDEMGDVDRGADEILRAAVVTALARTAGTPDDDALARLAGGIVRAWPRVVGERPRAARLDLLLDAGEDTPLPWITNAPSAPLARALAGHLVAAGPSRQPGTGRLRARIRLAIDTPDGWTDAGSSIGASTARLASPAPDAPCLHAAALDDGRAVVTRQDQQGGYLVDAAGTVTAAAPWPSPVFAQAPLDATGGWYAWTVRPSRLFLRDAGGAIVQDIGLPFTPTGAVPDGDGLRFTALDGVWLWSTAQGARRVVETEPLVAAVPDGGGGLDLAPMPPLVDGARRRGRRLLRWSPGDGLREEEAPPLGPCWSRSVHAGWTADAFPDAALIRLSDVSGVRGWMVCDHPRAVAWAGPALVVVSMAGRVLVVPGVREALRRAAAGS